MHRAARGVPGVITGVTMTITPRRKQRSRRGRVRWDGCTGAAGSAAIILAGPSASAQPPTLTTHSAATALPNHSRAARAGSVILVGSPCRPPRFTSLKPPAMMGRSPSHAPSAGAGTRSVRISPGAVWSSSPRARNGPARRDVGPDKQGARPPHPAFPCCTVWTGGRKAAAPSAR
jgi:hypothetical protein